MSTNTATLPFESMSSSTTFALPEGPCSAVIGLMSGTSLDAIDASLVFVEPGTGMLLGVGQSVEEKIPTILRSRCLALSRRCGMGMG